jgi:hypothetical protein
MLEAHELFALARDLANRKVLTVYLDNRRMDPALRYAWRAALASGLRDAREQITDRDERARFDKASRFFERPFPPPGGMWAPPGWVGFATEDDVVAMTELPRRVETLVTWQQGAVIGPCLRALKHERPVIVALVHAHAVSLSRYVNGKLEALEPVRSSWEGRGIRNSRRGRARPGARNAVETEVGSQRHREQVRRLASRLVARLTLLAGRDGFLLVGGSPEGTREVMSTLPRELRERSISSREIDQTSSTVEIVRAAARAARELRSRRGRNLVSRMLDHMGNRAVGGVPALQRALLQRAVDVLLVSPRFLHIEKQRAEQLLHAALAQGAEVEVLSGEVGVLLDALADGVAARLRFGIDSPSRVRSDGRTPVPLSPSAS